VFVVCCVGSGCCSGLIPRSEDFSLLCVWRPRLDVGCGTTRESRLFVVDSFPVFSFVMQQIVYSADFLFCFMCIRIAGNISVKTHFRLIEVSFWANFAEIVTGSGQFIASVVNTVLVSDLRNRCLVLYCGCQDDH
jgi:hypothetical protein